MNETTEWEYEEEKHNRFQKVLPFDWREQHPRCSFCKYSRIVSLWKVHYVNASDYTRCEVKDKIIRLPSIPRPWCRCFSVRITKQFEE